MVIARTIDAIGRSIETSVDAVSETFFEPVVRLGVTGLSRAGKTVFITSLVANLIERGRMPGFSPQVVAAFLQPQPDDTVPRFDYETHLAAMTGPDPAWPQSTRAVSELRLSLRVQPKGLLSGLSGPKTVHLDIVDYPGEWLLDLALLDMDYATWSARVLARMQVWGAQDYLAQASAADSAARHDEPTAKALAESYTVALRNAQNAGAHDCTPGRFLLPGEMEGSPVLTFAPLPEASEARRSLGREMARRYEAYKARVVRPFFRDHFARIDRQVVLFDVLGAIHRGPRALEELRQSMVDVMGAFRPGRNAFLTRLLTGRRVDRLLFAATKADHLHHTQHGALSALVGAMVADAQRRAEFAGAETGAMSIASLRATTEETRPHQGRDLGVVRGHLVETGKAAAFYPGALPTNPEALLAPGKAGAQAWLDADYGIMRFLPAPLTLRPGSGPPHVRLDQAAEFLLADRLR